MRRIFFQTLYEIKNDTVRQARTDDIRKTENKNAQIVHIAVCRNQSFRTEFSCAIVRNRLKRSSGFSHFRTHLLTIYRRCRSKKQLLHVMSAHALNQIKCSRIGILIFDNRIVCTRLNIGVCSQMEYILDLFFCKNTIHCIKIADILLIEMEHWLVCQMLNIPLRADEEIVYTDNLMSFLQQRIYKMTANKASAARN